MRDCDAVRRHVTLIGISCHCRYLSTKKQFL